MTKTTPKTLTKIQNINSMIILGRLSREEGRALITKLQEARKRFDIKS